MAYSHSPRAERKNSLRKPIRGNFNLFERAGLAIATRAKYDNCMKKSEMRGPECGALHSVAEIETIAHAAVALDCTICSAVLAEFVEPKTRVSRLIVTGEPARFFAPPIVP